jgi:hypothetical protein
MGRVMADETTQYNVRYGYSFVRPETVVTIVPSPQPTVVERAVEVVNGIGWAITCIVGAASACALLVLVAPELAGIGGFPIGLVAFLVWDSRRG